MDPAHISRLKEQQEIAYQETQAKIQQWKKFDTDYDALQDRLKTLPDKVTHSVMVPFGPLAFMPGELIHTNEIMVLLGENWFAERSAKQACEIVDRRKQEIQTTISKLEQQSRLFADRLGFTSEFKDLSEKKGDIVEINEDYDPEKEKRWREERKRKKRESHKLPEEHKVKSKEQSFTQPSTRPAATRKEQTTDNQVPSPVKSVDAESKQESKTKTESGQMSKVKSKQESRTKIESGQSSKVKEMGIQDKDDSPEKKKQREEEEALWARLDDLERQEEALDELALLSDYDENEDYENQPMFSYLDPDQPPDQPQKPSLTRSDSEERRVKWKDQQVDEESSSSNESDDELPRPAVIHFTHTKDDAQQEPKSNESQELSSPRSPRDIYENYLTTLNPTGELASAEELSSHQSTSPHQIKSIMKPARSPEPVPKKPAKEILPQLDSVFSGSIVETNNPVSIATPPPSSQSETDVPVKRVSKFKASRQQKR